MRETLLCVVDINQGSRAVLTFILSTPAREPPRSGRSGSTSPTRRSRCSVAGRSPGRGTGSSAHSEIPKEVQRVVLLFSTVTSQILTSDSKYPLKHWRFVDF